MSQTGEGKQAGEGPPFRGILEWSWKQGNFFGYFISLVHFNQLCERAFTEPYVETGQRSTKFWTIDLGSQRREKPAPTKI